MAELHKTSKPSTLESFLFKKVELWVVLLLVIFGAVAVMFFGALVLDHERGSRRFHGIGGVAASVAELPIKAARMFVQSDATGLVSSEQRFGDRAGLVFNTSRSLNAMVVIPHADTQQGRWEIMVVDLLHREKLVSIALDEQIYEATLDHAPEQKNVASGLASPIWSPRFDKNLNITLLTNSGLIMQVDSGGATRWVNNDFHYHHTFNFSQDEGEIWAIGYDKGTRVELAEIYDYAGLKKDIIAKIDSESGVVLDYFDITTALIDHGLHNFLFIGRDDVAAPDPLHINDVQPVTQESAYFSRSDVFVSLGHANMVLLYDAENREIKWHTTRSLFHQHDVDIISANKIAIFNNNRIVAAKDQTFKHNQIVAYDFEADAYSLIQDSLLAQHDIRTVSQGLFEKTSVGLFVEETNFGRVMLFDGGEPVFEYLSKNPEGYSLNLGWSYIETDRGQVERMRGEYRK